MQKLQEAHRLMMLALEGYNEMNLNMNLVLFEDAIYHITRINRILETPRGNALLIGVGGSGKQSLSRLAAHISGLDVFQISLRKGYGMAELKADLALLYVKAGLKNIPTMFLMTEGEIPDEQFLVLMNDLLSSGRSLSLICAVLFLCSCLAMLLLLLLFSLFVFVACFYCLFCFECCHLFLERLLLLNVA